MDVFDLRKYLGENKLLKENNWIDYDDLKISLADIGQFSTPEKEWGKYKDKDFVLKGKEIVDQKYGGDVDKAYDTIVKGKTKDDGDVVGVDIAENNLVKEIGDVHGEILEDILKELETTLHEWRIKEYPSEEVRAEEYYKDIEAIVKNRKYDDISYEEFIEKDGDN